jgi:hypothetical protein
MLFISLFSSCMRQVSSLDVWLHFLVSSSTQVSISIAWILASCVRNQRHRDAVTQWLPPADRSKETKGKRGWERPDVGNSNAPGRGGGWLARNLGSLYKRKDLKVIIHWHIWGMNSYCAGARGSPVGFGSFYQRHSLYCVSTQAFGHRRRW